MEVGFYEDELEDFGGDGLTPQEVAVLYADEHHEICDDYDLHFEVFVKDKEVLYKYDLSTDFDPVFYVEDGCVVESYDDVEV